MSEQEESFSGASAIDEAANEEIKKEAGKSRKEQRVPLHKLFSFADFYDCVLMAIGSIGACVHGASVPVFFIFFGKMINVAGLAYLYPKETSHRVAKYSLDFVYLSIVILFASWTEVACWMHTGERQAAKMRMAYLRSMLNQDITLFDTDASTGDVISAITSDIIVVQDALSEKVGNLMHYISRFAAGFAIGFVKVWQISLVTLGIVPLIALAGGAYAYVTFGLVARVRKAYVKAGGIAQEVIANVRTVQAFSGEERAVRSYRAALINTYRNGYKAGLAKGLGLGSMHCVLFLSWALLVWFTSIVVHKNIANGGVSFTTMLNVVISSLSLGQAAPDISAFVRARAAAYPIFEMIERDTVNKTSSKFGQRLSKLEGNIQFKDVCFSYPSRPDVPIFNNLCLEIPSGKIVALVGGSGSGKSTIISLIERFYEPLSGQILLDGHDIRGLDLRWLRQQIGLVNQEPALFATSIKDNILYGKDDATLAEINYAVTLSDAQTFINNLPDGLDTKVGERGIQLSGGQKQRIAISRAIVKNPSILLLDEATSALDAESEKSVQEALDRVMVGRTTVIVAHRLSTIKNADIIAVVQQGKIVETGNHEELISNPNGVYASLVEIQESASLQHHPRVDSSMGQTSSVSRTTSFGGSFHSDKESVAYFGSNEGESSIRNNSSHVSIRRLYSMVGPDWYYGVFGTLGAFIAGALMPLFALGITHALVAYYMDWNATRREIRKIAFLFCGAAILAVTAYTIEHLSFGIMGERLTLRVRETMFSAVLKNEIAWFDDTSNTSSMLSSRLEADATLLRTIVVDRSTILFQNVGLIVTSFIIAFILNWRVTLVVLATYPLIVSGHISEKLFMKGFGGNLSKAYLKANMLAGEAVSNIRTVAAFCCEEKVIHLYAQELVEPSKRSFKRGQIAGIFYGISQFFIFSSYGLALWYGSVLMQKELSSFKSVMKSFMVLIVTALAMGETLALAPDMLKGNQMAASVFEVMDRRTGIKGDVGEELHTVEGTIELKNIHFRYPSRPDVVVFNDFNMRVPSGKTVALVGHSGSGKSSVISLILRFYDPTSGRVMIDGKDIRNLNLKSVRKHIGFVQQEPVLFATSIYENILYGKEEASNSEVVEAAKLANAHNFISGLPEGYSTKVGERGAQLSGGQRQRIAIARAILKNPAILLLDEATSALDVESERVVQQALDKLMNNRTTIVVAHRLSTIRNAYQISVVDDGKIVEQGTHSSLIQNKSGAYYKLVSLQQQHQHLHEQQN
ncbi:ABC transporter B family member 2-like [Arachis duranensis]|uniref:ABC transporter B family member 2-like n=1 Tax=Arachis duranensis TaxID=130453 RepID=A0A6P5N7T8_ARADU|nr:ABC transporter B family member 2-like [Arachis duranensis]XP_015954701.1 ABC transporter B family member 2-like [Arachis duranensis]XP_020993447.1 ABC transporter B family member 2-like [Arachis duranensis]XP_020993451.1 ABC transporter B family member 2-like [Arachis duranensis]XP_052116545.1 ABC transporter B family member 2-like [Arachis duranensis]XP_052116547.1 ABC transporter B family member 2-like [Arachis duranensis]XP_052116548.1 ABC transporter B family member 2-like [Arachis du